MDLAVLAAVVVFWVLAGAVAAWWTVTRLRDRHWRVEAGVARGRHRATDQPGLRARQPAGRGPERHADAPDRRGHKVTPGNAARRAAG